MDLRISWQVHCMDRGSGWVLPAIQLERKDMGGRVPNNNVYCGGAGQASAKPRKHVHST